MSENSSFRRICVENTEVIPVRDALGILWSLALLCTEDATAILPLWPQLICCQSRSKNELLTQKNRLFRRFFWKRWSECNYRISENADISTVFWQSARGIHPKNLRIWEQRRDKLSQTRSPKTWPGWYIPRCRISFRTAGSRLSRVHHTDVYRRLALDWCPRLFRFLL